MKASQSQRIAVIDLGSNTARLIVMNAIPGYAYRLEDEIREVVRLRQGMTEKGLSEEAMARAFSTLRLFKRFCDGRGVDLILPTTTAAVREAPNGPAFVERIRREIGLSLQVLDGEREAYYGTLGALNEVPITDGWVLDIGGGSAEVSEVRDGRFHRGQEFPLGALALTERYLHNDTVKPDEFESIQEEIERQLDTTAWIKKTKNGTLIGLGGTIRNLARIESKRQKYPLNTLHGFKLSQVSVAESMPWPS
jgi:exopolyphosphatase/guanosine-5'-triphosphate,3'-diphosphate pyrophosphatase